MSDRAEALADELLPRNALYLSVIGPELLAERSWNRKQLLAAIRRHYPEEKSMQCQAPLCNKEAESGGLLCQACRDKIDRQFKNKKLARRRKARSRRTAGEANEMSVSQAALEIFQSWDKWSEDCLAKELSHDEGMMDRIQDCIEKHCPSDAALKQEVERLRKLTDERWGEILNLEGANKEGMAELAKTRDLIRRKDEALKRIADRHKALLDFDGQIAREALALSAAS